MPKVVIVGRTNVGKSTLFNRLSVDVKSITLDYEGVTRDFVSDVVCWQNVCFTLIDSGGISLKKAEDSLAEKVRNVALDLVGDADLVLFVCDGLVGITLQDQDLAGYLHKIGKPVVLVINKVDSQRAQELQYQFQQLGFKETVAVSAQHGTGIAELLDALLRSLPKKLSEVKEEKPRFSMVLIGKPNVGKSSLMNELLERERVLVTDQPGTTREAITEPIRFYQETISVTDTPGIRRKRTIEEPLEKLMVKSAFNAVDHSSIVLLLIDGASGVMSDQELKLTFYALSEGKALIMLINKSDLMDQSMRTQLEDNFEQYSYVLSKIPHLYISCKTKKNIGKIMPLVSTVWQTYNQVFSDEELTMLLKGALQKTPLFHKGEALYVKNVRQVSTAPITLLLRVNKPLWFGQSQLAFFENILRAHYNLLGVPVIFVVRMA